MREGLDLPAFGELPFDQFILGNWDPTSPLSKHEQKRALVEKWIAMGKYGRNEYALSAFEGSLPPGEPYPPDIPQDLLTETDRSVSTILATALWIRTWFGGPGQPSQEAADAAYQRLREAVTGLDACMAPEFIYDERDDFAQASSGADIEAGTALGTPSSIPGYLVDAMMHCPELFEGCSDGDWRHFRGEERKEEEMESRASQVAMVLVADRKACKEGWVLLLALNHRGQVLPYRVRERASEAAQHVVNWAEGQPLVEMAWREDDDGEFNLTGGDGWD
ncbi:hypothetical protein N8T08_007294 [Aspergillus melleus]|uniref:Uncharacterized protein n=1 Tax=Aspergillus melleus TaxID=138277 RepID=A0ACC3AXZ8_9EURO|nr:hypothetical protein N8T08_007294 [Aspergillus melleus]